MSKSQNIYDNEKFFIGYKEIRENKNSLNNIEEKPALFSLALSLKGKKVLDLGCGFGENCGEFKKMGADKVVGIDISENMLGVAKSEHSNMDFRYGDIENLSLGNEKFDVVFSSLTFHYIMDFEKLMKNIYSLLENDGCLIFSQEHPFTTAPFGGVEWAKDGNGKIVHYKLSDYASGGKRNTSWIVDDVIKYHRTFSDIINTLVNCGFRVEKMLETTSSPQSIHKPNFLVIRAIKVNQ